MSIFDNLKKGFAAAGEAFNAEIKPRETFTFPALPESVDEMKALPESALDTPFKAAALTVCAFCAYAAAPEIGKSMINFLKGPEDLTSQDEAFICDRLIGKEYVPFSYFAGAVPDNDYKADEPYTITITSNAYSFSTEGYAKLFIKSGGADSARPIELRRKGTQWFLWNYSTILMDIRVPKSADPWSE